MSYTLLAHVSREFLAKHRVYRYNMTKITEMDDPSVIRYCHRYCEENNLTGEFRKYREEVEAEFVYCPYLQEYIALGLCYDMQMIKGGYIKKSALDIQIDRKALEKHCTDCKNQL